MSDFMSDNMRLQQWLSDRSIQVITSQDDLTGSEGDDTLVGHSTDDKLTGHNGDDKLNGRGGDDNLFGGSGKDHLDGGSGNDHLDGGSGNDVIIGGVGSDILTGGKGNDIFVLKTGKGRDTVRDFVDGQDHIGLASGVKFSDLTITQVGSNTLINLGSDNLARLNGVRADQITAADFTSKF